MKNIIGLILLSSFLFSNVEILNITEDNQKIKLDKLYYNKIDKVLSTLWEDNIHEEGNITIDLKVVSRKGVLDSVETIDISKTKKFNKAVNVFLNKLKKIRINRERTDSGFLTIRVRLSYIKEKKEIINPISVYKDNGDNIYKKYIKYIKYSKGYTIPQIEGILNNKKNTITKFMLLAIYNDYILNKKEKADYFYDIIINQKLSRFINNIEGLYIVDYLLREKEYGLILEILPELSCEFMKEPEKSECNYFRASSMYNMQDEGYIIPLSKSKDSIPQAKILLKTIKEKEDLLK